MFNILWIQTFCFASVPSRETNPMLLSPTALESRIHSAFASGNSLTKIHDADNDDDDLWDPTLPLERQNRDIRLEIRYSRNHCILHSWVYAYSASKTATYAYKYDIRATTELYTHESTHTVQVKPQHTLGNTVFARPMYSHSWVYANILNVMRIDYSPNVFGVYESKIHVLCIYITVWTYFVSIIVWTYSVCIYYGYCILFFYIRVFTVSGGFCTFSEGYLRLFFS
jgi:hypothetical protein